MKKIISVLLSAVIVLTGITSFHVFAYDVNYETMTVDVVCNYPKDLASNGLVSGIDRTNTFKAHFIKAENEDNVYILLDDIKYITRSEIDEIPAGYRISQGDLVINLIKGGADYYYCSYDKLSLPIRFVVYNNALYIEPEVILSLLSAQCSFTDINNKRTLLVDLPQYTLFEALKGFDINKYYVGNLLTQGIKDNEHIVVGTLKFLGNFKRLYNQYALDSALNLKYELINPMGVDRQVSSEMAEVYAQVLGYNIETDTTVAETEAELYENIKNLLENFTDDDNSDNNIINFYIDSYAHTGARDEKSLELFNNTLKKLSNDEKVMSKLKEAGKTSMSILTNTIVEYMKRHSYDKKVLNNFKNTFSEEARNIVGLQLSDDNNDKIKYEAAMDYYETCFSDSALLKEIIDDELYSTIMEAIVMKPLDWSTGGAASEFIEVYEKIMTVAKLREMSSSFQPLTKIENASKYIFLTVMQRMIADIMSKAANKMEQTPNQSKEFYDVLMGSIDMFYRTSIVMMETLKDSWQQGALSDKEKNILSNADNYISELTVFDYKLRNSSVPDFSQNSIDKALKNKVFKNEFFGTITGRVMTQDEEPLKNAKISVFAVDNGVGIGSGEDVYYTDDDGKFSIPVSARNEYMLQVTCDGYKSVDDNEFVKIYPITVEKKKTTHLKDIYMIFKGFWREVIVNNPTIAAISNDDELYMWGENNYGQIGVGKDSYELFEQLTPIKVLSDVKSFHSYENTNAVITQNDELYIWGYNGGRVGNGKLQYQTKPLKILDNVKNVFFDSKFCSALTNDDELYMWNNEYDKKDQLIPVKVLSDVKEICIPDIYVDTRAIITKNGDLYVWGKNGSGQIGNGTTDDQPIPVKILSNVKEFYFDYSLSAAITNNNDLYMWGTTLYGQLGMIGAFTGEEVKGFRQLEPLKIFSDVKKFYVGEDNYSFITNSGDLYIWGDNFDGQIGDGTIERKFTPVKILDDVKEFYSYGRVSSALKNDGDFYIWGNNVSGTIGNGDTGRQLTPFKALSNVKNVVSKGYTSAAITNNNTLYMWGVNFDGNIGNGSMGQQLTPFKVLNNVKDIFFGERDRVYAITNNDELYIWGDNSYGAVGNGETNNNQLTPIKILDNVKTAASERSISYAITNDNTLYTWGYNFDYQIGSEETKQLTPTKILDNIKDVYFSYSVNVAITTSGDIYTWGVNLMNQVGNGTTEKQLTPYKVTVK